MKEKRYMFLCDQKRSCKNTIGCGTMCRHTADVEHCKNEVHKRFVKDISDPNLYWEWEGEEE